MHSDQIQKVKELFNSLDIDSFNQSLIKDNKIIFVIDKNVYRCTMPSQKDLALAEDLENKLKVQFLQKEGYVTKRVLKKILKEKQGIDIDELEKEKDICQNELKDVYIELNLVTDEDTKKIDELKKKVDELDNRFTSLMIEITEYLQPCIEEQIRKKYYEFLTYHCTEKCVSEEKWERVWKTLEEYETDNSKLAHTAVAYLQTLLLNVRS